jgi:hypothetical protein
MATKRPYSGTNGLEPCQPSAQASPTISRVIRVVVGVCPPCGTCPACLAGIAEHCRTALAVASGRDEHAPRTVVSYRSSPSRLAASFPWIRA